MGYSGGTKKHPTYHSLGDHTEVVRIRYDPHKIDFNTLLSIFWKNHNPSITYQKQYWSIIFYQNENQKSIAQESLQVLRTTSMNETHTKIIPFHKFFPAENYHQKYILQTHPWLVAAMKIESGEELIKSHVCTKMNGFLAGYGELDELSEAGKGLGLNEKMVEYVSVQMKKSAIQNKPC